MRKNPNIKICLVSFLFDKAFLAPLSNLENVLSCVVEDKFYVIEGCFPYLNTPKNQKIEKTRIFHSQKKNLISRIILLLYLQLRMSFELCRLSKKFNVCVFFMGQWEFLPILVAKIMNKKVLWLMPSSISKMREYDDKISSLVKYYSYIQNISFFLSDKIIIHSDNLLNEWNLMNYKDKIVFAHEYYLNFKKFNIKKTFDDRGLIIGFLGRFSKEKGIINFVKSIPLVLVHYPNLKFIVIGDGNLNDTVQNYIQTNNLSDNVEIIPWLDQNKIPFYLNEMKLLVIPSYTESGPINALESMACGTPILISQVGHVYNLIQDGKNGFLLENNSPKCIAKNIQKIISYANLEEVSESAHILVKTNFSFEKTLKRWKDILYSEL